MGTQVAVIIVEVYLNYNNEQMVVLQLSHAHDCYRLRDLRYCGMGQCRVSELSLISITSNRNVTYYTLKRETRRVSDISSLPILII